MSPPFPSSPPAAGPGARFRPTRIAAGGFLTWLIAGLTACASPGDVPLPGRRLTEEPVARAERAPAADGHRVPARWWTGWAQPDLDRLVERALTSQPGLQATLLRLQAAQAQMDAVQAQQDPQVTASLDLTDQRFTRNGLVPYPLAGAIRWNAGAQLGGGWELDLFGRQRATLDAAIGQYRAAEAEAQAARVLLATNVVAAWVQLARAEDGARLAREQVGLRTQSLALVRERVAAGLDADAEQRAAEGALAQARLDDALQAETSARARRALAELCGLTPDALDTLVPRLPSHAAALPATLPADLLGRRADLLALRWRVEASLREVDQARALFYPNVNLIAFVGLSSIGLDRFVRGGSQTYGVGPAVRLPVFDGGRLRAQLRARSAEADAAVEAYNAALLRALREVADELGGLQAIDRQEHAQQQASAAAAAALDLARQRFDAGLGNRLAVLQAQAADLAQRRAAADLHARRWLAHAALARALGGGFLADAADRPDHPPPAPAPLAAATRP